MINWIDVAYDMGPSDAVRAYTGDRYGFYSVCLIHDNLIPDLSTLVAPRLTRLVAMSIEARARMRYAWDVITNGIPERW